MNEDVKVKEEIQEDEEEDEEEEEFFDEEETLPDEHGEEEDEDEEGQEKKPALKIAKGAEASDGEEEEAIEEDGSFRNDLFEKFSFTHAAIVNSEPEWLKVKPSFLIRWIGGK